MRWYFISVFVCILIISSISLAAGDKWTKKADMPTARSILSTSAMNGKIYAIGGSLPGDVAINTVEEYDPTKDTWIKKADMPTERFWLSTSVVDGKIYAIGGCQLVPTFSTVEVYDPATDKWAKCSDMPTARWGLSTNVVNGRIYAIGGGDQFGPSFSTAEEYDPVKDKWTKKADMPTARDGLSIGAVNGKIYAIGGKSAVAFQWNSLSAVEEYDPVKDTWTKKSDMPTARCYLSVSVVNGKIYAIGGASTAGTAFSMVEVYDPATDKWTKPVFNTHENPIRV